MKHFILAALFLFSISANACKFIPDGRPLEEQLNDEPIVFEGIVTKVDGDEVKFKVTKWLHGQEQALTMADKLLGITTPTVFTTKMGKTTCHIRFTEGDYWLYAGISLPSPSRLIQRKQRLDDSSLELNPKWQVCTSNEDCAKIFYSCSATAVNKKFKEEVEQYAWKKTSNPSAVKCKAQSDDENYQPLCEGSVVKSCGLFK